MTPEERKQLTDRLYNLSVSQLIELVVNTQEELEEYKQLRRRFLQIRNLLLDPEERRPQGRPRKQQ